MSDDTSSKKTLSRDRFRSGFLQVVRAGFVRAVAESFLENMRQIEALVEMPHMLFGFQQVDAEFHSLFIRTALAGPVIDGDEYTQRVLAQMREFKVGKVPQFSAKVQERYEEALKNETYGPTLRSSMHVLYSAAVSSSWTAFECAATDLWVEAMNQSPQLLAQSAARLLDSGDEEITHKQISIGLAARHGFDLRHCLGTILRQKFDFTGVTGIEKAYGVFGPQEYLANIFADPTLRDLEAARHLIVHRAGRVDAQYKKRTKSTADEGAVLTFPLESVLRYFNASQAAGIGLLAFVNDWFYDQRPDGGAQSAAQ